MGIPDRTVDPYAHDDLWFDDQPDLELEYELNEDVDRACAKVVTMADSLEFDAEALDDAHSVRLEASREGGHSEEYARALAKEGSANMLYLKAKERLETAKRDLLALEAYTIQDPVSFARGWMTCAAFATERERRRIARTSARI